MFQRSFPTILFWLVCSLPGISAPCLGPGCSSQADGELEQNVVRAISIKSKSNLNFGTAIPGASAKTVQPGQSENPENASFIIEGEPNTSFSIYIPYQAWMVLTSGGYEGDVQKSIRVSDFESFPSKSGTIGASGRTDLFVGATRARLHPSQKSGRYVGRFTVTVVY